VPQGHHPNSRKNLRRGGPGRPEGSRSKFSKEAIARFVEQYRHDLAADWNKHGEQFVAKCRELYPQIYATMQRMRIEDELSRQSEQPQSLTIKWATDPTPPPIEKPPLQIPYRAPEMPADLTPADWAILMNVVELLKRTIPSNSDAAPAEIFGILKTALLAHFADEGT
jgi:hypothetical protein